MSQRVIYGMLEVYRASPILRTCAKLTWSHHRELLRLATQKERNLYAQQADRAGCRGRERRAQVKADAFAPPSSLAEEVQVEPDPQRVLQDAGYLNRQLLEEGWRSGGPSDYR